MKLRRPSSTFARSATLIALLALGGSGAVWMNAARAGASALTCDAVPVLLSRLHDAHLQYKKPTKETDQRLVQLYLEDLDPTRALLLASESDAVGQRVHAALKEARKGKCTGLEQLQRERVIWNGAMESYVRASAPKVMELDRTVELAIDPDERGQPTTDAERNELRRELLQLQLAGYVARGVELPEARKRLVHRYELLTRRVTEMQPADVYGGFLDAAARALDPHTSYFTADALEDFRIGMELSLEGIGAVLTQEDGYTIVREVVAGGAAARQGQLKPADRIVAVSQGGENDAVDVVDMALRDVVRLIRGAKGTPVQLSVLRQGETTEAFDFVIVRDAINLDEQAASLRWESVEVDGAARKLAVLDLPGFYGGEGPNARNVDDDVKRLLEEAKSGGAEGLLLDLSQNGGGLLQSAVTITGYFLGTGPVVGVGGDGEQETYSDEDPGVLWDGPLVVLTSRLSASASEIVAGALKDHARAVLVGDPQTFGKGSVQHVLGMPPGYGALKVTIALFYRPNGESTQNVGVPVDVVVQSPFDLPNIGEKSLPHPLPPGRIAPLLGGSPNPDGVGRWTPLDGGTLERLRGASASRVALDADLIELASELAEASKSKPVARVSELLDGRPGEPSASLRVDPADEDGGLGPDEEPTHETPQLKEALSVLADLVAWGRGEG